MEACVEEVTALVALLVMSIIAGIQIWYALTRHKITNLELVASALVGLILGLFLDVVAGKGLGMWAYTRHPYWTVSYWTVLPAMWTEFGIGVYILWKIVRPRLLVAPILMLVYEAYGVLRGSWVYPVAWWVVALGWIPLILVIVVLTNWISTKQEQIDLKYLLR